MSFTAAEYAREQGISVSTARRRLEALCWQGKATSYMHTGQREDSPLSDRCFHAPFRMKLYRLKAEDAG